MQRSLSVLLGSLIIASPAAHALSPAIVDCVTGHELSAAIATAIPGSTIAVTGTCYGPLHITTSDLTLLGDGSAVIEKPHYIPFPLDVVTIDGATRVQMSGFTIRNGLNGVKGEANASFTLDSVAITDNILGLSAVSSDVNLRDVTITSSFPGSAMGVVLENTSSATFSGTVDISNMAAFGINVQGSSALTVSDGSTLVSHHNLMGGQISVSSSFVMGRGSNVTVHDNRAIGLSVNTGSTALVFNANLTSRNNGLDGIDVISNADIEVDADSRVVSENNGRQGISVDNAAFNMFGFLSTQPGLPSLTVTNNAENGIQVESTSKLDIGRNATITVTGNSKAGISLDDGSSAVIQQSNITGNSGETVNGGTTHDADIVATFGSRLTFNETNNVGFLSCDNSSYARGNVKCNQGN